MKNYLLLFLVIFLTTISLSAQNVTEERITAYFKAFNTGDEKAMGDYFKENATPDSLKQRPIEQRLQFYERIRADTQTVTIRRILGVNDNESNVWAQSPNGDWFKFIFMFESQPPNKLIGLRVERTEAPNLSETSARKNQPLSTEAEFIVQTGNYIDELVRNDEFSGVVLIAKNEKPLFAKAFGLADKDAKIPNRLNTKFNLGSLNKVFTQIAIEQLAQGGKISFDDKLGKYLPDYPNKEAADKVTIRHLLTMTSGVGDIFGEKFKSMPKEKLRNIKDFIPLFSDKPLAFEPGTKNQYSNGGYVLLGAIIEKVTGRSYYDYVRENIFQPLGMTDTDFFESDKPTQNMAEGYTKQGVKAGEDKTRRNNLDTRPARGSSAGGGYSTAEDLLKFSLALRTGKIQMPDESLARKDSSKKFTSSIGVGGGAPGINSAFEITSSGYTIIVLSNYDPPSAGNVAKQINDYLAQINK